MSLLIRLTSEPRFGLAATSANSSSRLRYFGSHATQLGPGVLHCAPGTPKKLMVYDGNVLLDCSSAM
jgi:hypothetical protein